MQTGLHLHHLRFWISASQILWLFSICTELVESQLMHPRTLYCHPHAWKMAMRGNVQNNGCILNRLFKILKFLNCWTRNIPAYQGFYLLSVHRIPITNTHNPYYFIHHKEVTRKLHHNEFDNLYSSPHVITMSTSRSKKYSLNLICYQTL